MNRNFSLDILKLLMAFMVVGLHAGFLEEFSGLGAYLSVNGIFRIAVPVFLVINGFYFFPILAKKSHSLWFKRVIILYAVWMCFYAYFWFQLPETSLVGITKLVIEIIIGYHHLWYISGMLGAALLLLLLKKTSSKFFLMTIVLFSLTGVTIQYLGNYHYFEGSVLDKLFNLNWFHRNALLFSYPFFCIGYLINKHKIHEKITFSNAIIMTFLGFILLMIESYVNYYQEGREGGFDNYLSLLLVSPFVFITFFRLSIQGDSKNIALYSSAIYFIHSFFLSIFRSHTELESTMITLVCIIASIVSAYFIIKINDRVRFIL